MTKFKKILIGVGILVLAFVFLSVVAEEEKKDELLKNDTEDSVGTTGKQTKQEVAAQQSSFTASWTKYTKNPVLKEQTSSHWFQWAGDPFVIKDSGTYKMWFGANVKNGITQIGYATSDDGVKWKIHPGPVLKIGKQGAWDDFSVETPSVIKNSDGTYEMWYTGAGGAPEDESAGFDRLHKIGYATSKDGINWVKRSGIVLDVEIDNPSDWSKWDFAGKADPMVSKEEGIYKMWYSGAGSNEKDQMPIQIGYATSQDGIHWKRNKNPVLSFGSSWDKGSVAVPAVSFDGEKYVMLYTGKDDPDKGNEAGSIGCALSTDGIKWEKTDRTPCLSKSKSGFDKSGLWGASLLYDNGVYKAWYSGLKISDDIHVSVGYAFIR